MKYVIHSLILPLINIIECFFVTSVFPAELKTAKVVPVYKKGDPQLPEKYRQVSLLPSVLNIFEKSIGIHSAVEYIMTNLDWNQKFAGLYFDLSKAFAL